MAMVACGGPAANQFCGQNKIAFYSYRDGNFEIYVMNADGTGVQNLTNNSADDVGPVWSPACK